ncbi:hypothetical protein BJY04DRAFT_89459 [Aspergillus karnatakaensis]|uniref:uncharacterized protein n=1 Tax=Aspergillus karnatakaensis TaxID=1810916 RepID=UPI003CCCC8C9
MISQCPSQTDAFRDLSRIFANRHDRVLEFEILPPAFGPILEDGDAVGITKKYLVQAFVIARRVFFDGLQSWKQDDGGLSSEGSEGGRFSNDLDSKLVFASEIILLFDCEHLTACNWRKKRLSALLELNQERYIPALHTELSLLTTYLTSRLHRHTKSPTLWQHRKWIRTHLVRAHSPDVHELQELIHVELSVVLRAGDSHPRNYYAFSYMRQMHHILSERGRGGGKGWGIPLARSIIAPTLDWCLAHPADISGLMFLLYLLNVVPDTALRVDTVSKVARFAVNVGWEGESIWTFIELSLRGLDLLRSLEESQVYPWDILRSSLEPNEPQYSGSKPATAWKTWLDRARAHWVQSTNTPHA